MQGKKTSLTRKASPDMFHHRTGTSFMAFCRGLLGVSPHGFGCLPVKIPWEIFQRCLGVGGAKPGSGYLREGSDSELAGPHLSLSSLLHNSAVRDSFALCPRTQRKTRRETKFGREASRGAESIRLGGSVFFRGKSASAGGRRGTTQPSHAGHAEPWLPGASRREPALRGPQGPGHPAEGRMQALNTGSAKTFIPLWTGSAFPSVWSLRRAEKNFLAFRLSGGGTYSLRCDCYVDPQPVDPPTRSLPAPPRLPPSPASHPVLIIAREPWRKDTRRA